MDVKYLNKFQRLPFVGIPREVKGQISYKNQLTGKSNGDVPIIVISLILRIPCHNVIEYHIFDVFINLKWGFLLLQYLLVVRKVSFLRKRVFHDSAPS